MGLGLALGIRIHTPRVPKLPKKQLNTVFHKGAPIELNGTIVAYNVAYRRNTFQYDEIKTNLRKSPNGLEFFAHFAE